MDSGAIKKRPPLIAVIGAGISGLSAAYCLKQKGCDIRVLEMEETVGGTMKTVVKDGFLIDIGPNSALETTPRIRELISTAGLEHEQVYANHLANNRYILRGGKLHALPLHPLRFLRSRLFSAGAKLRIFLEPFIKPLPEGKQETIAEFVERRLGREFLEYAINPFVAGVYAGNPRQLSVAHAVPKVYQLEQRYGSLIKGAIRGRRERKKRAETSKHTARLFSFKKGMEELPRALHAALGDAVITGAAILSVSRVQQNGMRFHILYKKNGTMHRMDADGVCFCIPSCNLAPYIGAYSTSLADILNSIPYARVAMVFIGAKKEHCRRALDGFGFLAPEIEKRSILGTIWSSTLFPGRAPEDSIALTTFIGGARQPELLDCRDDKLIDLTRRELRDIIGLQGEPKTVLVKKWLRAIPQYIMGYENVLSAIDDFEKQNPGIFIGGNFRRGIGIGDCIAEAYEMADRIQRFFERR